MVSSLGYLRLGAIDLDAWKRWAQEVFGLGTTEGPNGSLRLRVDDRAWRIELAPAAAHAVLGVGWEVPDASALEMAATVLQKHGIACERASAALCDERAVSALLQATDPAGIQIELFWGPLLAKQRFAAPLGTRFVTGGLGLGHVVFKIPRQRFAAELELYQALGFRLSDTFRVGTDSVRFLRCNSRHHSFAIAAFDVDEPSLVHSMLEAEELDSVGLALDAALAGGAKVKRQLGRHTNDRMVSFYSETPSGFDLEFGWGGRLIDDATWTVAEVPGGTLWGHRPPG